MEGSLREWLRCGDTFIPEAIIYSVRDFLPSQDYRPVCAIPGFIFLSVVCKMHVQLHNNCSTCMTYLHLEISMSKPKFITPAPKAATPGDLRVLINGTRSLQLTQNETSETSLTFLHLLDKLKNPQLPPKRLLLPYAAFYFRFYYHLLVNAIDDDNSSDYLVNAYVLGVTSAPGPFTIYHMRCSTNLKRRHYL